jgi:hypothetical protein
MNFFELLSDLALLSFPRLMADICLPGFDNVINNKIRAMSATTTTIIPITTKISTDDLISSSGSGGQIK